MSKNHYPWECLLLMLPQLQVTIQQVLAQLIYHAIQNICLNDQSFSE